MPKFLKRLFNNKILNNQKGSTLSVTIVVIAVMAFSVTSLTNLTVDLSGATQQELENVNEESIAKGYITTTIEELRIHLEGGGDYGDFTPNAAFGLNVADVTDQFSDFGNIGGSVSQVIRVGKDLSIGHEIFKYVYITEGGVSFGTDEPFDFALGTQGDLILNGGYYNDISLFGTNIYMSGEAPWVEDKVVYSGWPELQISNHVTSGNSGTLPTFTEGNDESLVYYTNEFNYCTSDCWNVDEFGASEFVIDKGEYGDVTVINGIDTGDIQGDKITSFFNEFSFEEFLDEYAGNILPTDNKSINETITVANFEDVIRDNMDVITYRGRRGRANYPNTAYTDISNDSNFNWNADNRVLLRTASVYDTYNDTYWDPTNSSNELVIWDGVRLQDWDEEGLIVLGDLTINNGDAYSEEIRGTYIVTGDLTFTGERLDFRRATFVVLGETRIVMDQDYGFYTNDNGYELSIIGLDNIHVDYQWEDYGLSSPSLVEMLLYTEESIVINSVVSKVVMRGGLFAKASGNSSNPIPYKDELGNQINGLVINSYRGYVSRNYYWNYDLWTWDKQIQYSPRSGSQYERFQIEQFSRNAFNNSFFNIPEFGNVTLGGGEFAFEVSEWKIE